MITMHVLALALALQAQSEPEGEPAAPSVTLAETSPDHPRYRDCAPPDNFSKRFPSTTIEQAIKRSYSGITRDKAGLVAGKNPVTGALVQSEDVYTKRSFGIPIYGHRHTYARITQTLDGPREYTMLVSSTNISSGSKNYALNDLAEIYVTNDGQTHALPLFKDFEEGWCNSGGSGLLQSCFSTGTALFTLDEPLYEALANADPDRLIMVPAKARDGQMLACPLYFAPLSFKVPLLMIEGELAKAAEKRAEQVAQGF